MDRHEMRVACFLVTLVALLPSASLAEEPFPEALTLVELNIEALTAHPSLDFAMDYSMRTQLGAPMTVRPTRFRYNEGKFLLQAGTDQELIAVMDSDHYLWAYTGATGHYTKNPPSSSAAAARQIIRLFAGPRPDEATVQGSRVVRSETIQIDGQPRDCWVTQNSIQITSATDGRVAIESIWFDKNLHLVLKKEVELYLTPGKPSAPLLVRRDLVHDLRVDPVLDDSLFVFVLPPGATEIPLSATGATKTAPAPAVTFGSPGRPLVLIKQVAPVYPELARKARQQGTVRLAATISEDGTVGELRVISGPPLLVEAAIAAVKQWIYKPTRLNGNPIAARTTVEVNFSLGPSGATPATH